jgi:TPR repeat protein
MNLRLRITVAGAAAALFALCGTIPGRADDGADCDRFAASPHDPERHEGIEYLLIDATSAISACQKAVLQDPQNASRRYHLGRALARAGNKVEAFDVYRQAADMGYAAALYAVADLYESGDGVERDYDKALSGFQRAASAGMLNAEVRIGRMHADGHGVPQNFSIARELYMHAAKAGSGFGLVSLGYMFENGQGVERDAAQALNFYRQAAEAGWPDALAAIGYAHEHGNGVEPNPKEAANFYRLAYEAGSITGANNLGWAYGNGIGVDKDEKEALRLYRLAADLDEPAAQNNLGWAYENGLGVDPDLKEAARWYQRAVDQGYVQAAINLAYHYETGSFGSKDLTRAEDVFRTVIAVGSHDDAASSRNDLAWLFVQNDIKLSEAVDLARASVGAAQEGDPQLVNRLDTLGVALHKTGEDREALANLERAASLNGKNADVFEHIGDVQLSLGQKDQATDAWQRALDLLVEQHGEQERIDTLRERIQSAS